MEVEVSTLEMVRVVIELVVGSILGGQLFPFLVEVEVSALMLEMVEVMTELVVVNE